MPRRFPLVALLPLLTAVACHKSSNSGQPISPPTTISATVVGTTPAVGTVNVEPDTGIFIEFSEPVGGIPEGAILIEDGAGPLPGTLTRVGSGLVWRWDGTRELSRGALIKVRVTTTGGTSEVGSFLVRETVNQTVIDIPAAQATGVMSWPNGRSLVVAGIRSWEIVDGAAIERILPVPPIASFDSLRTFGDGRYVYTQFNGLAGTLVRGSLDGATDAVPMPTDSFRVGINENGDVVTLVAGPNGPVDQRGLWRLRAGEIAWELAGPMPNITDGDPCIDGQGNVMVAVLSGNAPRLVRFEVGNIQPQFFDFTPANPARDVSFGVGEDGVGTMVWREDTQLRGATFAPGTGLVPLTGSAVVSGSFPTQFLSALTSSRGSTLAVLTQFGAGGQLNNSVLRLERNGWFGVLEGIGASPIAPLPTRERGEWWSLQQNGSELQLLRSRPGAQLDGPRVVYTHSQGLQQFTARWFGADDSGRIVLAINETPSTMRIVLLD